MAQIFTNNFSTTVATELSAGATTLIVADASGLPSLLSNWCYVTLIESDVDGNESDWEIVRVNSVSSNTLTVVRAQDGTSARIWPVGTPVEMRQVAGGVQPRTDHLDEIGAALVDADTLSGEDAGTGNLVSILVSRIWTYVLAKIGANASTVRTTISAEQADATILKESDVDDTPVNSATTAPVSSNWAFDHAAASNPHGTSKSDVGLGNVSNDAQLKIASNLSDLASAVTARSNLGLAIGSQVQAYDADTAKLDVAQTWTAKQTFRETVWGTSTTSRTSLDPVYGDSQRMSVSSNTTFSVVLEEGQSILLTLVITGSPTISFGAVSWFGGAPTLDAGTHRVAFDRVGSTNYGTYCGKVS